MPGKHSTNWLMPPINLSFMRENTEPLDFCVHFISNNSVLFCTEFICIRYIFRSSITESYMIHLLKFGGTTTLLSIIIALIHHPISS